MKVVPTRRAGCFAVAAGLSLMASTAFAADRARDTSETANTRGEMRAIGGADAPNARLAALIDAGGFPIRTKGVQSVQRIDEGVYCIRPTAGSGVNVNSMIAVVSTEYFYSQLDEIKVQWASTQSGCGAGRFGVYTFQDADTNGNYVFSNAVGFSVVVP